MTDHYKTLRFSSILAAGLLIAACGGSSGSGGGGGGGGGDQDAGASYSGSTSAATLSDAQTAEDMGRASGEGARQANTQESAPTLTGIQLQDSDADHELLEKVTRELVLQARENDTVTGVTGPVIEDECASSSGNASMTFDSSSSSNSAGTITYNNFCVGTVSDGSTLNGQVSFDFSYNASGEIKTSRYEYSNVQVTDNATQNTDTLNMVMNCVYNYDSGGNLSFLDCDYHEDFVGTDGVTYRIDDAVISESNTTPGAFDITAAIYHPDHGYVDIMTTSPITYGCASGLPDGGTVEFTDGTNTVTVQFHGNCTEFTVTYDNEVTIVSDTYNW